jgi:hypothetical protein
VCPRNAPFTASLGTRVNSGKLLRTNLFTLEGLRLGTVEHTVLLSDVNRRTRMDQFAEAWAHLSSRFPGPYHGKPLIDIFINTLTTGGVSIEPGFPTLVPAGSSALKDYAASAFSDGMGFIGYNPKTYTESGCLRHGLQIAEIALDHYRGLGPERPGLIETYNRPSSESCE